MDFTTFIALFFIAFVSSSAIIPLIIKYAEKNGLIEQKNERKLHAEQVSNLGGIGIFLGFAISVMLLLKPDTDSPVMAFALGVPLLLLGALDDICNVGIITRLVVQVLLGVLLFDTGLQLVLVENDWLLNLCSTVFLVVVLVNAFNFIDGINGLAGTLGLFASLLFGGLLATKGAMQMAMACFAYSGSLLGFLAFNFGKKAKIFMGDNGSTVLGFFLAVMLLSNLETKQSILGADSPLPLLLGAICVPVVDIFKVIFFRLLRGQSPFHPDRTHIHHLLTDGGLSHPAACACLLGCSMLTVATVIYWPGLLRGQAVIFTMISPYLLAAGIIRLKNFRPSVSSSPISDKPALHNLRAN